MRKLIYPKYKGQRHQNLTPQEYNDLQDAHRQMDILHERIIRLLGFVNNFKVTGYESDDILAYLTQLLRMDGVSDCVIISSDEDLYQLLWGTEVGIYNPTKDEMITEKSLMETHGVTPAQWVDVKAIAGCDSDNVAGVPGVGPKTATLFVKGTLARDGERYKAIVGNQELIERNRKLIRLPLDGFPSHHIQIGLNEFKVINLLRLCRDYGMNSLRSEEKQAEWRQYVEGIKE